MKEGNLTEGVGTSNAQNKLSVKSISQQKTCVD